jgi:hypothetical protein
LKTIPAFLATFLGLCAPLFASHAYLPSPGTGNLQPVASVQWARDFWVGDQKATLPSNLVQTTAGLDAEYGIAKGLAIDLSVGVSTVNYQGGPLNGNELTQDDIFVRDGLTDTRFGLSWRLMDEFENLNDAAPTLTVRVGGIIAGNYETGFLNAVSDGADGAEIGLKFGKIFIAANAGLYGDFAYRWLSSSTPDEWEASVGVFKTSGAFTYSAGLREKQSVGGIDILGPGFSLDRFPDVREKNRSAEIGLTWNWRPTTNLSLGYARTLTGENTPKKNVFVSALNIQF